MNTITIKLNQLQEHPAQMRTRMDPDEMARLVLQVVERGLDEHQPIIVADAGDGTYHVVSGHRRWLARLLAAEVKETQDEVNLASIHRTLLDLAGAPAEVRVAMPALGLFSYLTS